MDDRIVCNNAGCTECHPPEEHCSKCQAIVPYMDNGYGNHEGGMRISFHDWFGGTIDPFIDATVLLCDACATTLLHDNTWLGETYRELVPMAEA